MAKPRVFVSSTYYDLRTVRDDLDRFIREVGYEPVRHERGHISYGKDEKPEEYAYREIDFCDIVVCIVGGRFGTTSSDGTSSITQKELKSAVERGKQVYIFVEDNVHHEHRHFLANKGVVGVRYSAVDNQKIHEFLEEVYALPKGNPIFSFTVSADITKMLREQWSGLFQRLLTESSGKSQATLIEELQRNLQTVGQLVEFLTDQKGKGDSAIQQILFANHPLFSAIKEATRNAYRLYFTTLSELEDWLKSARYFQRVETEWQDSPEVYEWVRKFKLSAGKEETHFLYIHQDVFTAAGDVKPMTPASWKESFVRYVRQPIQVQPKPKAPPKAGSGFDDFDDDIPF
jgi:Domain of unknown function (DUF4062)